MPINTFVAGNSGSVRQLADSVRNLGAGVEETATGLHRGRSESEADWEGPAGDAFRNAADRDARDADRLAQLHTDLATALTSFADDLDTVKARMQQAKQVANDAKLRVLGDLILPPDPSSTPTSPGDPAMPGAQPAPDPAVAALHAKQQAAYAEAETTVNQARDAERAAHQRLTEALKANSSTLDHDIGQRNVWDQAAAAATTPAAAGLAKAATAMDDWAANATRTAFEQAIHGGPAAVHSVWTSLTSDQQADLKGRVPQLVGSTNGVPTVDRDDANRSLLTAQRQALANKVAQLRAQNARRTSGPRGSEFPEETESLKEAEASLAGLDHLDQVLGPPGSGKYLIALDSTANDGRGQTIVASGNPDTANHVATLVPGTFHDVHDAADYVAQNDQMLQRAHDFAPPGQQTAAIMYGNYEAPPNLPNAASDGYATGAEQGLSDYQESLRATHDNQMPPSHNTVIGHSYGTTVVGQTARDHGIHADDVVFFGSPGVGVEHANQLGMPADHVWSGTAPEDPIQTWTPSANPGNWVGDWWTGQHHERFGMDPSNPAFGGNILPTNPQGGHSDYWTSPQSLDGMARVVVGQGRGVNP